MPIEHGFGLKSIDVIDKCEVTSLTVFPGNKMADTEEALPFSVSFYIVYAIFKRF